MIRLAFSSVADTAIVPLQDILGLDTSARMNMPGRPEENWLWRFEEGKIDQRAHDRLAELTAVYSRWNGLIPAHLDPRFRPPEHDEGRATEAGDSADGKIQTAP
jgi:4-alpha-glucanotransferase